MEARFPSSASCPSVRFRTLSFYDLFAPTEITTVQQSPFAYNETVCTYGGIVCFLRDMSSAKDPAQYESDDEFEPPPRNPRAGLALVKRMDAKWEENRREASKLIKSLCAGNTAPGMCLQRQDRTAC
jgi:hypothetical protein